MKTRIVLLIIALVITLSVVVYAVVVSYDVFLPTVFRSSPLSIPPTFTPTYTVTPTYTATPTSTITPTSTVTPTPIIPTKLWKGYISECGTTHRHTIVSLGSGSQAVSGGKLVHSTTDNGPILENENPYPWGITISTGPIEGNWWVWIVDGNGNRFSESIPIHTDRDLGLYKCQWVTVVFYSESEVLP